MSKFQTFIRVLREDRKKLPQVAVNSLVRKGLLDWVPDKAYLKLRYRTTFCKKLDLRNPKTFNEKLQWMKLYDRRDLYTTLVDKHLVKEYVAEKIGQQHIIPTLGVWEYAEQIDFDALPTQFVLKWNHDSGSIVICKDKATFDRQAAVEKLKKGRKQNGYWHAREWPYKNVKPCIIAEKYMEDEKTGELRDYKFFCFDGDVKAMFIATERQKEGEEVKFDFFDADGNHLDVKQGHPNAKECPQIPGTFETMKELAKKLSLGIPQVRVDFYEVNGEIFFGELTFSHFAGMVPFNPESWDETLGSWIKLPNVTNANN